MVPVYVAMVFMMKDNQNINAINTAESASDDWHPKTFVFKFKTLPPLPMGFGSFLFPDTALQAVLDAALVDFSGP